jgi:hypothetical protein
MTTPQDCTEIFKKMILLSFKATEPHSNRLDLTPCSTSERLIAKPSWAPMKTGQIVSYKNRTDRELATFPINRLAKKIIWSNTHPGCGNHQAKETAPQPQK